MIVKKLSDIVNTERDVDWGNGRSRRFLIEKDNVGYSVTDTIINEGSESLLEYKNHIESCYCIEGHGEIESDGVVYPLSPDTIYCLNNNDKHYLRAKTKMRLICFFSPALKGHESHQLNSDGSSSY